MKVFLILMNLFIFQADSAELDPKFCEGKESNSYHTFPGDCSQFIMCMQDFTFPMKCSAPLHFSLKEKKCDWRQFAGCEYIPTTTGQPTTTTSSTTPKPTMAPGAHCDPNVCKLPNCRCAERSIPAGLKVEDTPQMILLGFHSGVTELNYKFVYDVILNGRKNPNGCNIKATFFVPNSNTNYVYVDALKSAGHEIAAYSSKEEVDFWRYGTYDNIKNEMVGQRDIINSRTSASKNDVVGWRTPQRILSTSISKVLANESFKYDSSIQVSRYERWWPYTLDYPNPDYDPSTLSGGCPNPPCPKDSYPGLWEIPMNPLEADKSSSSSCPSLDDCLTRVNDRTSVKNMLTSNLEDFRKNKVPFGIYGTAASLQRDGEGWKLDGFTDFVDEVLGKYSDVYFVTMQQALAWMKNVTKLSELNNFKPWQCR